MGMTEQEAIISHIEECKHRIYVIQNYIKDNKEANVERCERNVFILENIIKALKKQIAKKPLYDGSIVRCPMCSIAVDFKYYCDDCGQKIDWGNEDAE